MEVHVRLYSNLREYAPNGNNFFITKLGPGATLGSLLETLEVPASVKRVALVNGHHANEDTRLAEGDTVVLFPFISGG